MDELSTHPTAPVDLLVTGGRLVTPQGVRRADVAADRGRIVAILPPGTPCPARRTVDASGHAVLPGLIDSHVHFRTPGLTDKEDWAHGSRAAAAGGVTTVIDMPNTRPPLFDLAGTAAKVDAIDGDSLVDYRFHLGVDGERPHLLAECTPQQAVSAKIFLAGHHTAPNVVRDPAQLDAVFATAGAAGLRLVLHAEDDGVFAMLDAWRPEPDGYRSDETHRPRSGGIVAVARVIELVRRHGTAAHVLHVSSAEETDLLSAAAHAGLPVTFEVTAHHLSFIAEDAQRLGTRIRLSPAIRRGHDRDRLWAAVAAGQVSTIGSDHAPHPLADKLRRAPDAPPGLPGVQELLPAVFTGLVRRFPHTPVDEHLVRIATLLAANPARLFGLSGRKGAVAVGLDADFTIFDDRDTWSLRASDVYAKCGWSAYEGWLFTGRVVRTIRRGEVIWDADTTRFGSPSGLFLPAEHATRSTALAGHG